MNAYHEMTALEQVSALQLTLNSLFMMLQRYSNDSFRNTQSKSHARERKDTVMLNSSHAKAMAEEVMGPPGHPGCWSLGARAACNARPSRHPLFSGLLPQACLQGAICGPGL